MTSSPRRQVPSAEGDAFLLRVADKVGAVVLSNDSFQEFHGEYEWLFDKGRLIGGKPVPGIGWIFTPRSPVPRPQEPRVGEGGEAAQGKGRRIGRKRSRDGGRAFAATGSASFSERSPLPWKRQWSRRRQAASAGEAAVACRSQRSR